MKIKNADRTAMPCNGQSNDNAFGGLTKREIFAMHAMQGELAGSANHSRPEPEDVTSFAVKCADALLKELEK